MRFLKWVDDFIYIASCCYPYLFGFSGWGEHTVYVDNVDKRPTTPPQVCQGAAVSVWVYNIIRCFAVFGAVD